MSAPYVKTHWPSKPMEDCESSPRGVRFSCSTARLAEGSEPAEGQIQAGSTRNPHDKPTRSVGVAALLERNSVPEPNSGCVLWLRYLNPEGYGKVYDNDRRRYVWAHRASYEQAKGPIAPGLQIDHLCRVRNCINPNHLEAVTPKVNTHRSESLSAKNARKTHCDRGHPLEGENLYSWTDGHRHCLICQKAASRAHYLRNREKVIARTRARDLRLAAERAAARGVA